MRTKQAFYKKLGGKITLGACVLAAAVSLALPSRQYRDGVPVQPAATGYFNNDRKIDVVYSFPLLDGETNALIYVDGKFVERRNGRYLIHKFGTDTGIRLSQRQSVIVSDINDDGRPDLGVYDDDLYLEESHLSDGSGWFVKAPNTK